MIKIVIFTVIVAVVYSATPWENCKDVPAKAGSVKSVVIPNCNSVPCKLKKGTDVSFSVNFLSKETAGNLTAIVHGILGGIKVPFPLQNPKACQSSGLICPIKINQVYHYTQKMTVAKSYPSLSLTVQWELKDTSGKDLFCIHVPVALVN